MKVLHVTILAVLLLMGCSGLEEAPAKRASTAGKPPAEAATAPKAVAKEEPAETRQESKSVPTPPPATPVVKPEAPAVTKAPATAAEPAGKKEAPSAPAAKPAAPAVKPAAPAVAKAAAAPKPPALDLESLEKRLKETSAIGVMTKLTLKNQVDDLLERFKAHYDGRARTTLAQLRQPYDLLIIKVLSALQDGDPSLAKAVADSREAIWAILSDPEKFRSL